MFEGLKARLLVAAANKTNLLLLPDDQTGREIAESMFIDGAPVAEINQNSLKLWQEKCKQKPEFVSKYRPAADTQNGPLRSLTPRKYR